MRNVYLSVPGIRAATILENDAGEMVLHLLVDEAECAMDKLTKNNACVIWSDGAALPAAWQSRDGRPMHLYLGHGAKVKTVQVSDGSSDPHDPMREMV